MASITDLIRERADRLEREWAVCEDKDHSMALKVAVFTMRELIVAINGSEKLSVEWPSLRIRGN